MINQRILSNSIPYQPIVGRDNGNSYQECTQNGLDECYIKKVQSLYWECRISSMGKLYNQSIRCKVTYKYQIIQEEQLNFIKDFYIETKLLDQHEPNFIRFQDSLAEKYLKTSKTAYVINSMIQQPTFPNSYWLMSQSELREQEEIERIFRRELVGLCIHQRTKRNKNFTNGLVYILIYLYQQEKLIKLFHQMRSSIEQILKARDECRMAKIVSERLPIQAIIDELPEEDIETIDEQLEEVKQMFIQEEEDIEKFVEERKKADEGKLEKYYDQNGLKEKWKINSDEALRNTIRRIMVKETLSEAEHIRARTFRLENAKKGKEASSYPMKPSLSQKQKNQLATQKKQRQPYVSKRTRKSMMNTQLFMNQKIRKEFFKEYSLQNTIGECFNTAARYNGLFQMK